MKWNGFAKKFFILLPFWIAGILLILISVQLSELYTAQSKANEYAKSLLNRANEIYYNVNKSLDYLNENTSDKCGEALKIATYDYRFIEDAGRIKGNEIICSAMKMAFYGYKLSNDKLILDESIKIWEKIDGYMNSNFKVKVIAKKQSFIVLSPHAYNAYQIPPKHTTGSIMSLDGKITYYEFSNHSSNKFYLVTESRACSENKYFCANSRVYSNILLNYGSGRLFFYIIIGIFFGSILSDYINKIIKKTNSISYRLKLAINMGGISVAYQPIVLVSNGEIKGFEVLARWYDRKIGQIPPDIFIKESQKTGLYKKLNRMIIFKAINEMKDVLINNKSIYISINMDANEIGSIELINDILIKIKEYRISPSQIAIEILEGSTSDLKSIEESILNIKKLGLMVFIDDFGTGYSNLSYLSNLRIDKIKIDKIFTQSAGTNSSASFILIKICEIAEKIQSSVIFEGVENNQQKDMILSISPNASAQGWLYSKAVDITRMKYILEKNTRDLIYRSSGP